MQLIKSRVGTVLAGAAILALAGGGAAAADNWYDDDRGWDSHKKSRWDDDRHDNGRGRGHDRDPKPAAVGISHWSEGAVLAPGQYLELRAECQQEGHLAISGGFTAGAYNSDVHVVFSRNSAEAPTDLKYASAWFVGFRNDGTTPQNVRTWVVCATAYEDEPEPVS